MEPRPGASGRCGDPGQSRETTRKIDNNSFEQHIDLVSSGMEPMEPLEFLGDHFEPRPLGFVTPIELEGHVWGAPKGTTVICNLRKSWIIHIPIEIPIEISIENTHVEWSIYLNLPFVVTNEVYPAPIASHPCDRGSTPETLRNLPRFWRLERSNELILNS